MIHSNRHKSMPCSRSWLLFFGFGFLRHRSLGHLVVNDAGGDIPRAADLGQTTTVSPARCHGLGVEEREVRVVETKKR